MIKYLLPLLLLSLPVQAELKVAVIDSGLDMHDPRFSAHLCKEGHQDFTEMGLNDIEGHGTNVVGLIQKYAENSNYCLIILKYYHTAQGNWALAFQEALQAAVMSGADVVNISGGGDSFSLEEYSTIRNNPRIKFFSAAGNRGQDIVIHPYYPASYRLKNIIVIGNGESEEIRETSSNYGKLVTKWVKGNNVDLDRVLWQCGVHDRRPGAECKTKGSGTSYSTAIFTGLYLRDYK